VWDLQAVYQLTQVYVMLMVISMLHLTQQFLPPYKQQWRLHQMRCKLNVHIFIYHCSSLETVSAVYHFDMGGIRTHDLSGDRH